MFSLSQPFHLSYARIFVSLEEWVLASGDQWLPMTDSGTLEKIWILKDLCLQFHPPNERDLPLHQEFP